MIRIIVLSGGIGRRLQPISNKNRPKQLLKLFSKKTLLEDTISRVDIFSNEVYISTNKDLYPLLEEFHEKFIIEPEMKNTGPAIGYVSTKFNPEDILIILPTDHYIDDNKLFQEVIEKAINFAKKDFITIIGIKPTYPSTKYGYISTIDQDVIHFLEKPNEKLAKEFIEKGYYWNGGYVISKAKVILNELRIHEPRIFYNLDNYEDCPKIAFDKAVLEKSNKIKFVEFKGFWSDIGSFEQIYYLISKFDLNNGICYIKDNKLYYNHKVVYKNVN